MNAKKIVVKINDDFVQIWYFATICDLIQEFLMQFFFVKSCLFDYSTLLRFNSDRFLSLAFGNQRCTELIIL